MVESEKACVNGQVFVERGWVGGDRTWNLHGRKVGVLWPEKICYLMVGFNFQHVTS